MERVAAGGAVKTEEVLSRSDVKLGRVRYTHLLAPPAHEKVAGGTVSAGARASGALASLAVLGTHVMLSPRGRQGRLLYRHV